MSNARNEFVQYLLDNVGASLPAFSFPGLYPIFYLVKGDRVLCATCATKEPDEIKAHDCYMEGASLFCDECNAEIESAYGDPEETHDETLDEDKNLPREEIEVLKSAAGYYLGRLTRGGLPYDRLSVNYFPTRESAQIMLDSGNWTRRTHA